MVDEAEDVAPETDSAPRSGPKRFVDARVGSGRPLRWRRGFSAVLLVLPLILAIAAGFPTHPAPPPHGGHLVPIASSPWWSILKQALLWIGLGSLVGYLAFRWWLPRPVRKAAVVARTHSVELRFDDGSTRTVSHRDIEHVGHHQASQHVLMRLSDGEVLSFDVGAARALDLVVALTPDPRRNAARLAVGSAPSTSRLGCTFASIMMAVALLGTMGGVESLVERLLAGWSQSTAMALAGAMAWLLGAVAMGFMVSRRRVVVGNDGVRIEGPFRSRFVHYDAIAQVEQPQRGRVRLLLREGSPLLLNEVHGSPGLARRIRLGIAKRERAASTGVTESLRRRGRSATEWAAALREGGVEGSYRATGLRFEDLAAIVEDASVSPEIRVAAGVSLATDERGSEQVRIAAQACADADLQAALEAAATGEIDDRPLDRALRRREAED